MIATLKVLGLLARDTAAVAVAARRVVDYVQGGKQPAPGQDAGDLSDYYTGGDGGQAWTGDESSEAPATDAEPTAEVVVGVARGAAAELVGLSGEVTPEQLQRLLMGLHAVTGQPLLAATGSAGRAARPARRLIAGAHLAAQLPLEDAARIAGVSSRYLRRLAEDGALLAAVERPGDASDPKGGDAGGQEHPAGAYGQAPERDVLRADRDPATGRWLVGREELARFIRDREPPTVVLGFDLTCAAPKSISLLWMFGDDDIRRDIATAMDAGVDAAIRYLERHAAVGTVAGRNRPGLGLAVASYRHEISRAEEAHLHDHNVIVNAVPVPLLDPAGQPVLDDRGIARVAWRALDSEVLHRHVKTAGYVGGAQLRHVLSMLRGLPWGPVRNGVAELADFPRELLDPFAPEAGRSTRSSRNS